MEDRMLSDEILLGIINSKSGGGGGGTSDYDDLTNQPQINGNTLTGNKTASDLGLASEDDLDDKQNVLTAGSHIAIDDDTISVNRWTVPAGKVVYTVITSDENYGQNVHVQRHTLGGALIDDRTFLCEMYKTVNVDNLISIYNPYTSLNITLLKNSDEHQSGYSYTVNPITTPTSNSFTFMMEQEENANDLIIRSELDAALATKADLTDLAPAFSTATAYTVGQYVSYDGNIYKCTSAHSAGAWVAGDFTLVAVGSELESKQDTLTFDNVPTDGSNNPVKSGGIYDALATKADTDIVASDFSAATSYTAGNYCIYEGKFYKFKTNHSGAWAAADVDEIKIAGELASLKSGLTNLDNEVNGDATAYPYADVITIPDAVPSNLAGCNVKIEPVQDLHGYDKPWVGGAGKNKLALVLTDIKSINTSGTWNGNIYTRRSATVEVLTDNADNVIGFKVNGTPTGGKLWFRLVPNTFDIESNTILNGCPSGGGYSTYYITILDSGDIETLYSDTGSSGVTINNAVENANVYIRIEEGYTANNLIFYPMLRLSTETDATFAPYTNYCPITGYTEASVQRDGRNLWNGKFVSNLFVESDTYDSTYCYAGNNAMPINAGKKYTFSVNGVAQQMRYLFLDENKEGLTEATNAITTTAAPLNAKYLQWKYLLSTGTEKCQIESGESATDYEPYQGKTYTIALGDTIYGGTVDFDSGVMTVTHALADMGDLSWAYNNGYFQTTSLSDFIKKPSSNNELVSAICEAYSVISWNAISNTDNGKFAGSTGGNLVFVNTAYTTASDFKTAMNGVHVCYELATPFTVQLTPQQIQLLKGQNTLTASTGQISVTANGVSGSIGAVQEQVNDIAEDVEDVTADVDSVTSKVSDMAKGYFRSYATNGVWYKIGDITASKWLIHCAALSFSGEYIKMIRLRYDASQQTYNNPYTKINSVFGDSGKIAFKYNGTKAEVFIKAGSTGRLTYTVLSDGIEGNMNFYTPVLTEYTDSDMDLIESGS